MTDDLPRQRKLDAPSLARVRYFVSPDTHAAQFTLTSKGGREFNFTIPYEDIGVLIASVIKAARAMADRLPGKPEPSKPAIASLLSTAPMVTAVALGRDAENGDTLLWLETSDGGGVAHRFSSETLERLEQALARHRPTLEGLSRPYNDAAE